MTDKGLTPFEALKAIRGEPVLDDGLFEGGLTYVDMADPVLWNPLIVALAEGSWFAKGYREPVGPESELETIPAHLWDHEVIGLDSETFTGAGGGGIAYSGLQCFKRSHDFRRRGRKKGDGTYAADDRLMPEMLSLLEGGKATTPRNAAVQMVNAGKAVGDGSWEAKVRRLTHKFKRYLKSIQR